MTIINRCNTLNEKIDRYHNLSTSSDTIEIFTTRNGQISEVIRQLRPLHATWMLFRKVGIEVTVPNVAFLLYRQIPEILAGYQEDPDYLKDTPVLGSALVHLELLINGLEERLNESWLQYTGSHTVSLDENLLNILGQIPELAATIRDVRTLRSKVQSHRNRLPETDADIQDFDDTVNEIRQQWSQLVGDSNVISFLRACAEGAPLDLLTEEVRNWLSECGIERYFNVVIRRNF